jgi:N-acetylmuramic acid 6-phosphate etherase
VTPDPSTEARHPATADLDAWPSGRILEALIDGQAGAIEAVRAALPALREAAHGIEARLAGGGRLLYAGAGTSGRLALQDAAELPPTFGFRRAEVLLAGGHEAGGRAREGAEDDVEAARRAVDGAGVGPDDALVGLAASGGTPYTLAAVRRARERGAFTVGVANNPGAPLLEAADVGVLLATGPEVLTGSTRLAAGTAQKAVLNALSTTVLVRLGGAYGNLMVGMTPANEKLRARARRIVQEATGAAEAEAAAALAACEDRVRDAIVVVLAGVTPDEARGRLRVAGERVREALRPAAADAAAAASADDGADGPA